MKNKEALINFLICIVIPTVILMKFSSPETLGPMKGFCVALSFPIIYTLNDLIKLRKWNFIALIGLISILLTGGIGLLKMSPFVLALKEAIIPFIIAVVVLFSVKSKKSALRYLFDQLLNVEKVELKLKKINKANAYNQICKDHTYYLAASFFLSSFLNYILARKIVISPGGTTGFAEELGKMTALSYFVIALPSTIFLAIIFWRVISKLSQISEISVEDLLSSSIQK